MPTFSVRLLFKHSPLVLFIPLLLILFVTFGAQKALAAEPSAPVLTLDNPNETTSSTSFDFTGTVTDETGIQGVRAVLDNTTPYIPCTLGGASEDLERTFTCSLTGLSVGSHSVIIMAVDTLNNRTDRDQSITTSLEVITPTPSETPAPSSNNSSINIPSTYINIGTPRGMVTLPNGNIWYVDNLNTRIVQFNPTTNTIIRTVGRSGSAEGEFDWRIYDIATDPDGNLYVLASSNSVYKLDPNGGFLGIYDLNNISGNNCWDPHGIVYDAHSDSFYVTSLQDYNVTQYSRNMEYLGKFGSQGSAVGQFDTPWGITTDAAGRIYVVDALNYRVQVFNPDYSPAFQITTWDDGVDSARTFSWPRTVMVSNDGTINVTTGGNDHTIVQFDTNGGYIRTWTQVGDGRLSDMSDPEFMAKDASGNIYVSDSNLNAITKYSGTGTYISTKRNTMLTDGKLYYPMDVAYGPNNDLFVLDGPNADINRIQEFSNSGSYLGTILTSGESQLGRDCEYITSDQSNNLWVSCGWEIEVFSKVINTWTLTKTIAAHFDVDPGWGGLGGIAFNGNDLYVPNMRDLDVQKYTFNSGTGNYDYVESYGAGWDRQGDPVDAPANVLTAPHAVAIDSRGHLFVADWKSVKEYNETGTFVKNLDLNTDEFRGVMVDPSSQNVYVVDTSSSKIYVVDNVTGLKIGEPIGAPEGNNSGGSGQLQFSFPRGIKLNPVNSTLTVADTENSRVQSLTIGTRILNLIPSASVLIRTATGNESTAMNDHAGESLSDQAWDPESEDLADIPARLMFGDYVVADFTVDLTVDRDWSSVNVQTLPGDSKALVVNLNQTTAPGISDTHSLYVYRYSNQTSVNVCPDATTLTDVVPDCSNEYSLQQGDSGLTAVSISGKNYWKIDGLTGTGAFSTLFETGFELKDLMNREQINTTSSHDLTFGSTYDLTHDGDTLTVTFNDAWDLSGLGIGDLSLVNGSTPVTLSGSGPGTNTWGVVIDSGLNTITFTAPTGGTGYITGGATIHLLIADGAVVNPVEAGTYEINMRLVSDDGLGGQNVEVGSVNVPIVDSDQVDITGYVNNYLAFDIDTGIAGDTECGPTDCLIYGGGAAGTNYTVDLGELTSTAVNKSQDEVTHTGGSGAINSIYLDLTSNALNGTMVNVTSANGGLQGPNSLIASVVAGQNITANSGKYGFDLPESSSLHGNVYTSDGCTDPDMYCALVAEPTWVFNATGPVDGARVRMDIAAAAAYTDSPGTYTDTLTFVATGTF